MNRSNEPAASRATDAANADVSAAGSPPSTVSNASASPATARSALAGRRFVTAALLITMVLVSMEMTITSTAMPTIIGELHGLEHYSWVASIYLLACTVTMPVYGRLSDAVGRKRVLMSAIGVFLLGSLVASVATSMPLLILGRGVQGLGAGGVMPVVLVILGDIFSLEERAKIQGLFTAVWGTAALAGPALGALLVSTLGWRWVFLVNIPLGLLGVIVLATRYHEHVKRRAQHLDLLGAALLAGATTALLALVSRLGPDGWTVAQTVGLALLTVALIGAFLFVEKRSPQPILSPALLAKRSVGPACIGTGLMGAGFLCVDTYVPLYVQGGLGGGPGAAARVVTPIMLSWAFSGMAAAALVIKWGFRRTALLGATLLMIGFSGLLLCAIFHPPLWVITVTLFVAGGGLGPGSMAYLLGAQDHSSYHDRGNITASIAFFRTVGSALGVGLLGAVFNILINPDLERHKSTGVVAAKLLDPRERDSLPTHVLNDLQASIAHALTWVFAAMVAIALLQFIASCFMQGGKPTRKPTESPMTAE